MRKWRIEQEASTRLASLESIARYARWIRRELAKMDGNEAWTDRDRVYALKLFVDAVEQNLERHDLKVLK